MFLEHPAHPGRGVRLGYCMNLHAADDLAGVLEGLRSVTLPLARRFDHGGLRDGFGVGMYLPGDLALELSSESGLAQIEELARFLREARLDPFTFNAFPFGGFHAAGLKEAVFRPTWNAAMRSAYTVAVANIARHLLEDRISEDPDAAPRRHVSISTHTGTFAPWLGTGDLEPDAERDEIATNLALAAYHMSGLEQDSGLRTILSLEPEPRSLIGSTRTLPAWLERIRYRARTLFTKTDAGEPLSAEEQDTVEAYLARYLGTCLDACHVAVEYEEPERAFLRATASGSPLGKLQVSSALELTSPGEHPAARELLVSLDEPVYLHQVTGRIAVGAVPEAPEGLLQHTDLPDLERALSAAAPDWLACESWRCHFHVPVDLERLGGTGLSDGSTDGGDVPSLTTTRATTDLLLDTALARPERWGTDELHLEIETYTWNLLPDSARGPGDLVDGLEREYRHVLARLADAGWTPART